MVSMKKHVDNKHGATTYELIQKKKKKKKKLLMKVLMEVGQKGKKWKTMPPNYITNFLLT
jgi:hypothetical protein